MLSSEERRGFWREPDGTPTSRTIAFQAWALAAHDILAETAETYHGLISDDELVEAVQARSDIRTSQHNWLDTVLAPVAHLCHRKGEPPLTALVYRTKDGMVGEGYAEVLRVADLAPIVDPDKREHDAALARLECYQWAGSAPADGGEPAMPPRPAAPTRARSRSTTRTAAPRRTARAASTAAAPAPKRRVAKSDQPVTVCPTCFLALPATGICDDCG